MKIIYIEIDKEEMSANKTLASSIVDCLDNIMEAVIGKTSKPPKGGYFNESDESD